MFVEKIKNLDSSTLLMLLGPLLLLLLILLLWKRAKKKRAQGPAPLTLGLGKTRQHFAGRLSQLLQGKNLAHTQILSELEELLLSADIGVPTTQKLLAELQKRLKVAERPNGVQLKDLLAEIMVQALSLPTHPPAATAKPLITLVVGINGAGKTTTIAKLAYYHHHRGESLLLAAADTFRAGAIDQLRVWAERIGVSLLAQQPGADPAAVAFDSVQSGSARPFDRVIVDTAGRLHTKVNLMEELKKVKRVIAKALPGAPHEILLVLDGTQGQNSLQQARQFHEALELTGLIFTKLDSSAKGGSALGIVSELQIPICYLGLGEKLEDLVAFEPKAFVDALLGL